jgi:hypothetical protein
MSIVESLERKLSIMRAQSFPADECWRLSLCVEELKREQLGICYSAAVLVPPAPKRRSM